MRIINNVDFTFMVIFVFLFPDDEIYKDTN